MKKAICIILIIVFSLSLISCYQDLERNSLEDYTAHVDRSGFGYSSVEIDEAECFLPSNTFLHDYTYIEGDFYWREDDPLRALFTTNVRPEISFLRLKYKEDVYYSAKEFMLEEIEPFNDKFYTYNDYVFYENSNFIKSKSRDFPDHFTMACYNDEMHTLIFIGLYSGTLAGPSCLEEKYLNDIENNWKSFIDTYYGEIYDFSK